MKIQAEIVNGKCPTCEEITMLVGLTSLIYRCLSCGTDLEQYVNGKITYLPAITRPKNAKPFVKEWKDG
jgi:ribosomal protein S27E|tara:strand:+ start:162 stop:368 length:207 start_codon:yes stop_codon:yes gene_type:complete